MTVVDKLSCSHCGAPIPFEPGEILATCKYCGYTVVVDTGKDFSFEHSVMMNRYDQMQIEQPIKDWMNSGFLKPSDLGRKSKIVETSLNYLPFWIVSVDVKGSYKGIFERITPAVVKEGKIEKEYNWLVLARKAAAFPTREYDVPLQGKVPYDFRKIESFAKVLNSEVSQHDAVELAKQEITEHHRYLLQKDVDRIIDLKIDAEVNQIVYLHAPIWFAKFEYKGKLYRLLLDGATGAVIKGDIPPSGFGIF